MLNLPALVLPQEFVHLLKSPSAATAAQDMLRVSNGLTMVMERAFREFDEHRTGLTKVATALGWANFRERMASVYVFKALHGSFPDKTDMELVADIHEFENRFSEKSVAGNSRLFLLGFYLRLLNTYLAMRADGGGEGVLIPASVERILNLRQVRTDKADWLVLLCWHLDIYLGTDELVRLISAGVKWEELFRRLSDPQRFQLISNLLSYGASIQEEDPFLYERI
jgi:hypothetical protein